jgi:hypothetical protein
MPYGTLYLLPVFLGDTRKELLSEELAATACRLTDFIVENEKSARADATARGPRRWIDE